VREAREFVPNHPVIDQVIAHRAPDAAALAVYALAFVAIALLAARRPSYGLAMLILLVPFAFYRDVGATTITLPKIALLANIAGLAAGRRDLRSLRGPAVTLFLVCGLLVALATALSIAHAAYRGPALRETLKAFEYVALFATAVVAASADPDERPIRAAFTLVLTLVSILALLQEYLGAPSGIWFADHPIPRIAGPLEGPNQLAGFLGIALAVVVAYATTRGPTRYELAALGLGAAALVLTISRTGVITSLAAVAIVFVVGARRSWRTSAGALAAGCAAGVVLLAVWGFAATHNFAGIGFLGHFSTTAEAETPGTVGNRSELWSAALALWRQHPFFGIGAGNFEWELGRVGYPKLHTHANSLYVQALVEGGIPLALATLALVGATLWRFARGPFSEPLVCGALGASIGFATHQFFDLLVFYPKVGELWWIVLALAAVRFDAIARVPERA
jgi:O-antigen ligase